MRHRRKPLETRPNDHFKTRHTCAQHNNSIIIYYDTVVSVPRSPSLRASKNIILYVALANHGEKRKLRRMAVYVRRTYGDIAGQ